jgi:hypothetical protein
MKMIKGPCRWSSLFQEQLQAVPYPGTDPSDAADSAPAWGVQQKHKDRITSGTRQREGQMISVTSHLQPLPAGKTYSLGSVLEVKKFFARASAGLETGTHPAPVNTLIWRDREDPGGVHPLFKRTF